eukprot:SAG22_NODE_438_length_10500_cov_13.037496_5_plen_90_part_00
MEGIEPQHGPSVGGSPIAFALGRFGFPGTIVDLEDKAQKHGDRYTITEKQKPSFWVKVKFEDDDTFYWMDRFGPDSFEIFRDPSVPIPE